MCPRTRYQNVYGKMKNFWPICTLLVVVICSSQPVRSDTNAPPVGRPIKPNLGDEISAKRKRSLSVNRIDVCRLFEQQIAADTCPAFTEALDARDQEKDRKRRACVKQKGEYGYFDEDLRVCGSCLDPDCLQNDNCKKECLTVLTLLNHEQKLNTTSERLTAAENQSLETAKETKENLVTQGEKLTQLKTKVQQLEEKYFVLESTVKDQAKKLESHDALAKSVNDTACQTANNIKIEFAQLRSHRDFLKVWCGFLTVFCVALAIVIGYLIHLHRTTSNTKYSQEESGGRHRLLSRDNSIAASGEASNRADAFQDTTPASLNNDGLVLAFDHGQRLEQSPP